MPSGIPEAKILDKNRNKVKSDKSITGWRINIWYFYLDNPEFHLSSPGAFQCDYGLSVDQSECEDAVKFHKMAIRFGNFGG